ncbi:hypothetical protein GCM10023237_15030 [Streptomyces coeruleoprunus]
MGGSAGLVAGSGVGVGGGVGVGVGVGAPVVGWAVDGVGLGVAGAVEPSIPGREPGVAS